MIKRFLLMLAALICLMSFTAYADENKFYEETEDGQIKINLDCTLVSNPNYERPYYRLLSSYTDENGEEWYVVGGQTDFAMKASDCTTQDYYCVDTSDETRLRIVKTALERNGSKYRFGSAGPDRYDCSGFVYACMSTVGIPVPHSSYGICRIGRQIPIDALQPGDITGRGGHVGIYIGNGLFIHALNENEGVLIDSLSHYNTLNHFDHYINVVDG